MNDLVTSLLLVVGGAFMLLACVGVVRMPLAEIITLVSELSFRAAAEG